MDTGRQESDRFQELPFAGQFLLWMIRSWVEEQRARGRRCCNLRNGAHAAGLEDALEYLDQLMRTIAASAPGIIVIEKPGSCCLSGDEKRLLAALSSIQKGRVQGFESMLGESVPRAAVRIARMPAAQLMGRFRREGLVLPNCRAEFGEREGRLALCPDPGVALLQ
ncbi:hypothetical protein ACFOW6_08610 [Fodinicurvata halophila]|uniref:Uncharacterized protein n=1 Tax=Fodinicurvata halophila TaxID=1419723 RepID=A0ABV8UKM7_9PROT